MQPYNIFGYSSQYLCESRDYDTITSLSTINSSAIIAYCTNQDIYKYALLINSKHTT